MSRAFDVSGDEIMSKKSNRRMKWVASPSTIRLNRFSYTYRLLLLIFVSVIVISVPVVMYGVYIGEAQRSDSPQGMIWIAGDEFDMGSNEPLFRDAQPVHRVVVDGFWMDETEVSNAQFAEFIQATGYVTVAERVPRAEDYPGAPKKNLFARFLFAAHSCGAASQSLCLVELRQGRRLAPSRRCGELDR